jgi:hypothetical protein
VGRMTDRNLFVHVGHFSAVSWGFVDVYFWAFFCLFFICVYVVVQLNKEGVL